MQPSKYDIWIVTCVGGPCDGERRAIPSSEDTLIIEEYAGIDLRKPPDETEKLRPVRPVKKHRYLLRERLLVYAGEAT